MKHGINLTITVDQDIVRRARIRALERGTSVNAVVREFLEGFAGKDEARGARSRLAQLARSLPKGGRKSTRKRGWSREELYDERLDRNRTRTR